MTHSVSVRLDEYMYIEGMGHQEDGHPHLEEILEETEADLVMQVVLFGDHAEDVAIPTLRGLTDLFGDRGCLFIDIDEHGRQVAFNQPQVKLTESLLVLV